MYDQLTSVVIEFAAQFSRGHRISKDFVMSRKLSQAMLMGIATFAFAGAARAQHAYTNTATVDPTVGKADFTTIQAAINAFGMVTVKKTVLIYSGTYPENVTLDDEDENIDLVGIDRDGVIIKPSSGNGILITSGTETSRNNSIRNLTIKTTSGHGISIVKPGGAQTPKDIFIEGVTIEAAGTAKDGISGAAADTVRIFDCNISAADTHGIAIGDNFEIIDTHATAAGASGIGIRGNGHEGLRVRNCRIEGKEMGILLGTDAKDVQVLSSEILGGGQGVVMWQGDKVRFEGCHILAGGELDTTTNPVGIFVDQFGALTGEIVFQACKIESIGGGSSWAAGVQTNIGTAGAGQLRLVDCDISARCTNTTSGVAYGFGDYGFITVIGGSIETSAAATKETEVWDLVNGGLATIRMSGTNLSKWKGPIHAAGRQRSVTQRTIYASNESSDAILTATSLTGSEQPNVSPTGQPDVYRTLSVTGSSFTMDQDVYIAGTNWADDDIVEKLTLAGTSTVKGLKPFKTVTNIILPAQTAGGQTVEVGTTNRLGLYYPLSAKEDVLQQGRQAALAISYSLESVGTIGPDGVDYSWVEISSITTGDSFEWALLTTQ